MAYRSFFDLTICTESDIALPLLLGRVWKLVHIASARSKIPFAVAFPGWMAQGFTFGNRLRVFVQDRDAADALYDALEAMSGVTDLAEGSRVQSAKGNGAYEAYVMQRLPSSISKGRKSIVMERAEGLQVQARLRRMAQQRGLPFVWMRSSSGHEFKLVVERIAVEAERSEGATQPNGYGLSRATQIVALPVA